MYQLLCHVNVPAPADTCLTRTADRAILDSVPVMKRTVVITISDAETVAISNANDVGRIGTRAPQATFYFANHFTLLLYLILLLYCRTVCFKIIIMFACIRDYQQENVLG